MYMVLDQFCQICLLMMLYPQIEYTTIKGNSATITPTFIIFIIYPAL